MYWWCLLCLHAWKAKKLLNFPTKHQAEQIGPTQKEDGLGRAADTKKYKKNVLMNHFLKSKR